MELNLNDPTVKTVAGAAGTALAAPLGMPLLHGLAGIAVAGLGIFAVGTAATKLAGVFLDQGKEQAPAKGQAASPVAVREEGEGGIEDRLQSMV